MRKLAVALLLFISSVGLFGQSVGVRYRNAKGGGMKLVYTIIGHNNG